MRCCYFCKKRGSGREVQTSRGWEFACESCAQVPAPQPEPERLHSEYMSPYKNGTERPQPEEKV